MALVSIGFAVFAQQNAAPSSADRTAGLGRDDILVSAVSQEADGPVRKLRGMARIETSEILIKADEIDYNEQTKYAEARGSVFFQHFAGNEIIYADRVEYNLADETAKYYRVRGSIPAKLEYRPGILSSGNPFTFEGRWAERIKRRYILHDGFITNCKLPRPTWRFKGPTFDIIPGDRAIARNAVFRLKKVPLFYAPIFFTSRSRKSRARAAS